MASKDVKEEKPKEPKEKKAPSGEDNKRLAKIIRMCKETLSLPSENRSAQNLLPLQIFTNKIAEFQKLTQSARDELLRSALLETFEDQEIVFKYGDVGDKYYVVLSGRVCISIPNSILQKSSNKKEEKKPEPAQPTAVNRRESRISSIVIPTGRKSVVGGDNISRPPPMEEEEEEEEEQETVVAELGSQLGFGELALITNKPRAATVRASGETVFMVFQRDEYQNIIGGGLSKALEEKMSFFKGVSIFQQVQNKIPANHLQNLVYFFQPETFRKDEVVYRQGDKSTMCYLIKEGLCNLYVNPDANGGTSQNVFVSVLGPKTFFGETEVMRQSRREATVVAATATKAYSIEASILEQKIPRLIIAQLEKEAEMKKNFQDTRLQNILENEKVQSIMSTRKVGPANMKPKFQASQAKGKALRGAKSQGEAPKQAYVSKLPGNLTRRMRRNTSFMRRNSIERLAEPKEPCGHDGINFMQKATEQAASYVRPDGFERLARFRDLNRIKHASLPPERDLKRLAELKLIVN